MPSPGQIRAARGLLNWSQKDLAERAGVTEATIRNCEKNDATPNAKTIEKIARALDLQNIDFFGNFGVNQDSKNIKVLEGQAGFLDFYDLVYETMKSANDKTISVSNVDEREFVKWQGVQLNNHTERMIELGVNYRILVQEGDLYFPASSYAQYRWITKDLFESVPFYIFSNKLAFILFGETPKIYVISETEISHIHRKQFASLWNNSKEVKNAK